MTRKPLPANGPQCTRQSLPVACTAPRSVSAPLLLWKDPFHAESTPWPYGMHVAPLLDGIAVLQLGDILWFATDLDGVKYLLKDPRLEATQAPDAHKLKGRQIYRHLVQVSRTRAQPAVDSTV